MVQPATSDTTELVKLTAEVASMVGSEGHNLSLGFIGSSEPYGSLSSQTVEFANAAVSIMAVRQRLEPDDIARKLAFSTGTPRDDLGSRLGEALSELRGLSNE